MNSIDKTIFKYLSSQKPQAVAEIAKNENGISGMVEFFQLENGVVVVADIENLPETATNIFAFHIHEGSSCGNNFEDTLGHFNPASKPHPSHAGDLPPLFACNHCAWMAVFSDRFRVSQIVGRTVVIHSSPDDFTSQPAGNSGQKIACGKIVKT